MTNHIVGLVGGMSWHSSALYYRRLNEASEKRFGAHANIESVMVTLCFRKLLEAVGSNNWPLAEAAIVDAACKAEKAGASVVILTAFTAQFAHRAVSESVGVPVIHAGVSLAASIARAKINHVGLLGTELMLAGGEINSALKAEGIAVSLPAAPGREAIDAAIRRDLTVGRITPEAILAFDNAAEELLLQGVSGIAIACTELPLLLPHVRSTCPLFDGVGAHVEAVLSHLEDSQ